MGIPKFQFVDPLQEDKKKIEALKKCLEDKILKDVEMQKKAALLIEEWLKEKPKPDKR